MSVTVIENSMKPEFVEVEFSNGLESEYFLKCKYVRKTTSKSTEYFKQGLISCKAVDDMPDWYDISYYQTSNFVYHDELMYFISSLDLKDESVRIYFNEDTGFYTLQILDSEDRILY